MRIVDVHTSKRYEVRIGAGLLDSLGEEVAKLKGVRRVAVVSDSNVWPLYGSRAVKSLEDAGVDAFNFVFPAGEASKNGTTYLELLNRLAEAKLTRTDAIVALGGGVVGDLTGFAAATFLRGIRFVQVPTTLLAAVDSSVGGKTAIDLTAGKNLAGAFYQPNLVLCDLDTLKTLPEDVFRDGCAEVIKYGVLYDRDLFAQLREQGMAFEQETVIARCVELKRDVVMEDEFDTGSRMKLNLGHTIGHGVEACSHYEISHGKAVAIGMAVVARAACACEMCGSETRDQILDTLCKFELPITTDFAADALFHSALSDKKRAGGTVNLIVPQNIGDCIIYKMPVENLESFIKAGL